MYHSTDNNSYGEWKLAKVVKLLSNGDSVQIEPIQSKSSTSLNRKVSTIVIDNNISWIAPEPSVIVRNSTSNYYTATTVDYIYGNSNNSVADSKSYSLNSHSTIKESEYSGITSIPSYQEQMILKHREQSSRHVDSYDGSINIGFWEKHTKGNHVFHSNTL